MKRLLVLSNGAGEDAIASKILARLPQTIQDAVVCCPLVGEGKALENRFELCGPRVQPPSEGLFRESAVLAMRDLWHGTLQGHARQLRFLKSQRASIGLTVAVGDLFPVVWAGLAGLAPLVFVGTAKSVYHHPYSWPERWLLRRYVSCSLVRDSVTAARLSQQGVQAQWLGNAMMDEVQPSEKALLDWGEGPVLTLFPGSRSQAAEVLPFQLEVVTELSRRLGSPVQAAIAAAPGVDLDRLTAECHSWQLSRSQGDDGLMGFLTDGRLRVAIVSGRLGDLLHRSELALGQAGTANEQAAGAGVPVVAFDARAGGNLRWYRKRQKGLLGDAVAVVPKAVEAVVAESYRLLTDRAEHQRRVAIGRERMGPPGGTERMASLIASLWNP